VFSADIVDMRGLDHAMVGHAELSTSKNTTQKLFTFINI
jgi:hypothetical protein